MIQILDKKDCCGCSACFQVCTHRAIHMKSDGLGFLYPEINYSLCVDCGLCDKVCAFKQEDKSLEKCVSPIVYIGYLCDSVLLKESQSGGAFTAIAGFILSKNGIVYGAGFDENFQVVHKRIENINGLPELKGSKYVQSDMQNILKKVKDDLKVGKTVLFSGTPCQVAAIKSYVGQKNKDNLFLVDIICHGVSSPYIWRDYLQFMKTKTDDKLISVKFRNKKDFGWHSCIESFFFKSKIVNADIFAYLFYQNIMFRPSCGVCPYTTLSRISDITIGDAWRTNHVIDKRDGNEGKSLIICNTSKGTHLFSSLTSFFSEKVDIKDFMQPNLQMPTLLSKKSDKFYSQYEKNGFNYILKHYGNHGWRYKLKGKVQAFNYYYYLMLKWLKE